MVDPSRHDGPEDRTSLSGLSESEAREFHKYFTTSFLAFLAIALVAHFLTYAASPWGLHM